MPQKKSSLVGWFQSQRTFLSLFVSMLIMGMGDVINEAIGNSISISAIAIIGAYYAVELVIAHISTIGNYTYKVVRKDEKSYLSATVVVSLVVGVLIALLAPAISSVFGISENEKRVLSQMLALSILYIPIDAIGGYMFVVCRLQNKLNEYQRAMILFYAASIISNVVFLIVFHEPIFILVSTVIGYVASIPYLYRIIEWRGKWSLDRVHFHNISKYGVPLVGEALLKRAGVFVCNTLASYLPVELFAIHTVCSSAAITAEMSNEAYSAALFVLIPETGHNESDEEKTAEAESSTGETEAITIEAARDGCEANSILSQERYKRERSKLSKCRHDTAWFVGVIGFILCFVFAAFMHGSAPLDKVLLYELFYALIFIPIPISVPVMDFLVIQQKATKVLLGTCIGFPIYVLLPVVAVTLLPPAIGLVVLGVTGSVQVWVRFAYYRWQLRKLDEAMGVGTRKCFGTKNLLQ